MEEETKDGHNEIGFEDLYPGFPLTDEHGDIQLNRLSGSFKTIADLKKDTENTATV